MDKTKEIGEIRLKVLSLHDELTLFCDQCAFLCDAFAAVPAQHEFMDAETIGGINFYSTWVKNRLFALKGELGEIHKQLKEFNGL